MIAKNYNNINWKQANQKLFNLQYEILKAFKKYMSDMQYEFT